MQRRESVGLYRLKDYHSYEAYSKELVALQLLKISVYPANAMMSTLADTKADRCPLILTTHARTAANWFVSTSVKNYP